MEKWLYLLKHSGEMSAMPATFEGDGFDAFGKAARISGYTAEERIRYEKEMVTELDRKLELKETKENAFAEGLAKGLAKGEAKGRAEGIAEGEEKGRSEGLAEGKLIVAKNLLLAGMGVEQIAEVTGLSQKEISALG